MTTTSITILILFLSAHGFTIAYAACIAAKRVDEIMRKAFEHAVPMEPDPKFEDFKDVEPTRDNHELAKWLKFQRTLM